MSGHSHWSTIKRKKGATDAKRGQMFSKMAKLITVAAREGGEDPATNSDLRLAIERAKSINFPKENIEKAIKRGIGELEGAKLEEVLFEAYGPSGIALIIEGITDNKNRTLGEIKKVLTRHNGKLVQEGAVRWLFERKGAITINWEKEKEKFKDKEDLELKVIEAGAEDIYWHENLLDIYTNVNKLEELKENLEKENIEIESASLDWVAKEMVEAEDKDKIAAQKLFEVLDESDDIQEIYSNLKE